MTKPQLKKRLKQKVEERYRIYELLHESEYLNEDEQGQLIYSAMCINIQINELKQLLS